MLILLVLVLFLCVLLVLVWNIAIGVCVVGVLFTYWCWCGGVCVCYCYVNWCVVCAIDVGVCVLNCCWFVCVCYWFVCDWCVMYVCVSEAPVAPTDVTVEFQPQGRGRISLLLRPGKLGADLNDESTEWEVRYIWCVYIWPHHLDSSLHLVCPHLDSSLHLVCTSDLTTLVVHYIWCV